MSTHSSPSPLYPALHSHMASPLWLTHTAFSGQPTMSEQGSTEGFTMYVAQAENGFCREVSLLLVAEEGNEIDPRDELVARLMEYKRYKSVLEEMRLMEEGRSLQFDRGNVERELKSLANIALVDIELEQLTLYSLMKTFQRVLDKMEDRKKKIVHQVYNFSHSIQGQQIFILKNLKKGEQTSFESLFGGCKNRMHAIITFLALLELLNLQTVKVINGIGMNNFWLTPFDEEEYNKLPDANNDDEEE